MYKKLLIALNIRSVQLSALCLIGIVLYGFTLGYPFVFDDRLYILGNPLLTSLEPFLCLFELDEFMDTYLLRLSTTDIANSFALRPVTYLSFYLNYLISGSSPSGFRTVNIAIHISNTILIYYILCSIIKYRTEITSSSIKINIPFFVALFFLVHPLQTQSVTYITQRFTSFATLFYLTSMFLYIQSRITSVSSTRIMCYSGSIAAMMIGFMVKEIVFTLPVTLILVETILLRTAMRETLKRVTPHIICMAFIPIQVLRVADEMRDANQMLNSATDIVGGVFTRTEYAITQIRTILSYLRLLVLPYNQNFDPSYPLYQSLLNPEIIISILIWSAFFVAGVRLLRRKANISTDLTAFAIFWFPLTISVSSSFIPLTDLMFEHRSYLPSVAFFAGSIAYLNHILTDKSAHHKTAAIAGICLAALIFSCATVYRNQIYSSRITLWKDTIKKNPNKARLYLALGNSYIDQNRYEEAFPCLYKSIELDSNLIAPYLSLSSLYLRMKTPQKAVNILENYLEKHPPSKTVLINLALAYSELQWELDAIDCLKLALHIDSDNPGILGFLSELKYRTKQYDKAQYYLDRALNADLLDPTVDLTNQINSLSDLIWKQIQQEKEATS